MQADPDLEHPWDHSALTMSAPEFASVTREQLYELAWSIPMRTLASRFGLSDVGLAKNCRAMSIPVPPRGYWAKLAHGHVVERPLLPPSGPRTAGVYQRRVPAPEAGPPPSRAAVAQPESASATPQRRRHFSKARQAVVRRPPSDTAARTRVEIVGTSAAGQLAPRWLTVAALATYICRTEKAVRNLVARGRLPFTQLDERIYFDRLAIDRMLARNRIGAGR
jgi:hypothetical protein